MKKSRDSILFIALSLLLSAVPQAALAQVKAVIARPIAAPAVGVLGSAAAINGGSSLPTLLPSSPMIASVISAQIPVAFPPNAAVSQSNQLPAAYFHDAAAGHDSKLSQTETNENLSSNGRVEFDGANQKSGFAAGATPVPARIGLLQKAVNFLKSDKRKGFEKQKADNERILKSIYDLFPAPTEGEYAPKTWLRRGDLIPSELRNHEVITGFGGFSLSHDLVAQTYELGIPPKFEPAFTTTIENFISKNYDVVKILRADQQSRFWTVVQFKKRAEVGRTVPKLDSYLILNDAKDRSKIADFTEYFGLNKIIIDIWDYANRELKRTPNRIVALSDGYGAMEFSAPNGNIVEIEVKRDNATLWFFRVNYIPEKHAFANQLLRAEKFSYKAFKEMLGR